MMSLSKPAEVLVLVKENSLELYEFLKSLKLSDLGKLNRTGYSTKVLVIGSVAVLVVSSTAWNWWKMKTYFRKYNIKGPSPKPVLGNLGDLMSKGFDGFDQEVLKKYDSTCGYFEGSIPTILTSDVKLIKLVTIKDAASFINRRAVDGVLVEPVVNFMNVLKDDEWKNARSIVTTSFTSGKIKDMSKLMQKCSNSVSDYLNKLADQDQEFDGKRIFGCYTLDVISSCLFGFDADSLNDPDNQFIHHLKNFFTSILSPKFALVFIFPKFCQFLMEHDLVHFISLSSMRFLEKVSEQIFDRRRKKLENRADFIQNMVEHEERVKSEIESQTVKLPEMSGQDAGASKWKQMKKTLSDKEILAQCVLFLAAGYDTTATTLEFISYNLATNPAVQDKLIKEIDQVLQKYNGEVNYDSISEMPYMDMVISETLRMFPPALRTDRICNQDYEYNGMKIPKGMVVQLAIYAVHHDPKNYPEPEKFIPERFTDEAKKTRENETFIPFGSGQRSCIGMRFAFIEMKLLLAEVLSKSYFATCDKTPKKIILAKSGLIKPKDPIVLKIKRRVKAQ